MFPVKKLSSEDERSAAVELGVSVEVIKAVAAVEAKKSGFIDGTDLPVILFEGHKFSGFTRGKFDKDHPTISYPKWTRKNYKGGRGEYDRLYKAIRINGGDSEPALKSTSWGMFQIMGFNHAMIGYDSVREFVNDMALGEHRQMSAFVNFIKARNLAPSLRSEDWESFARAYNGPGYATNNYHVRLATELTKARMAQNLGGSGDSVPPGRAEAAKLQTALNVAIGAGLDVDGWIGPNTEGAIRALQRRDGLTDTGEPDEELFAHLDLDFGAFLSTQEM